jgi:2-desacetyl-2-hydroxyethyl bacteriochlorophyllide A dehydrogenase
MKTSSVIFEALGQVAVREVSVPPPGPGEVQIRTEYSVISPGTEGWVLQNVFSWQPTKYPCVPGYQRVGVIEALGPDVSGFAIGQRVAATSAEGPEGIASMWGSHCGLANTGAAEVYAIPVGVDPIDAASFVVAQVGFNAASRAILSPGDWVAVFGDGVIGQFAAQAARARGAKVVLVGHRKERLDAALASGIEVTVNGKEPDLLTAIRQYIGAEMVPVVIDTIQGEAVQARYMDLLPYRTGQVVYAGFSSPDTWANMAHLQQREVTAHFVSGWTRARLEATLDLMAAGKMRFRDIVSHHVPYSQAPEMWALIQQKQPSLGIVLDWTQHE